MDKAAAFALFERAAASGEKRAWRWLAELHEDPDGPAFDLAKAKEIYERAARGGDGKAMFRLGELEERARPDKADLALAYA
ncbi:MAG: hypothetical protein N2038_01760, partial [Geminicoccaceae bacterium]|nr:hypothetical protein [Geminicoccaceae bacterium]